MKKFFLLTIISALVLGVSSCKSDDDEDHALVGTSWVNIFEDGDEYSEETTLTFTTESAGTIHVVSTDGDDETTPFTYTYSHPTVTFTIEEGSMNGTINGNELTVNYEHEEWGDWESVYTKK